MVNSDMNSHLDKCLSEPRADGDEGAGPSVSVSDPRRVLATVVDDELSEGWTDFWNSNEEERPDEPLPEKENVASSDTTATDNRTTKYGVDQGDDDFLALPLDSPLEAASRIKTRAVAAATVASRDGGTTKMPFPQAFP